VSDFGLTKVKEAAKLDTRCGSPAWSAPEILRGEGCTEMADVFRYLSIVDASDGDELLILCYTLMRDAATALYCGRS
jgi:serine/threonine protein kinase